MTKPKTLAARGRAELRLALELRRLPPRVAWFFARAWLTAQRTDDRFSLASVARPGQLARLLVVAQGRSAVVELGTGTAWTAVALALGDPRRRVISLDPVVRPERERYLELVRPPVRGRIELRAQPDSVGPAADDPLVELLFIDSLHERDAAMAAFDAWRSALAAGAAVVFHDYGHPDYPGVREAVLALGLEGEGSEGLFVWRAPGCGVGGSRGAGPHAEV